MTSFDAGGAATYRCNDGYLQNGNAVIFCQNNGQWTTAPSCFREHTISYYVSSSEIINFIVINFISIFTQNNLTYHFSGCGEPESIQNASITNVISSREGGIATYRCNFGFVLTGNATRTCQASGQWSPGPICTPAALLGSSVNHTYILNKYETNKKDCRL